MSAWNGSRRRESREWLVLGGRMGMIIASNSFSFHERHFYHGGWERCEVCHLFSSSLDTDGRESGRKLLECMVEKHLTEVIWSLITKCRLEIIYGLTCKDWMTRQVFEILLPTPRPPSMPALSSMSFLLLGRFIKFPLRGLAESRAL